MSKTIETPTAQEAPKAPHRSSVVRWIAQSGVLTFAQMVLDVLTVVGGYLASYYIYTQVLEKWSPQSLDEFLTLTAFAAVAYVVILDRLGLYKKEKSLLNIQEMRGVFRTGLYAAAFVFSVFFYLRSISVSRITLTTALCVTPMLLYFQRQVIYQVRLWLHQKGIAQKRVLIYGAGGAGLHLAKRMFESPSLGYFPLGFLDDDADKVGQTLRWVGIGPRAGLRVLGGESYLEHCREFEVDAVFISIPSATFERNQRLVAQCAELGVEYAVVPQAYEKYVENYEWFELGGLPILRKRVRRVSLVYLVVKRLLDFLIAFAFLLILSPILLLIAFAIWADSKGPIIFKQKRVGLQGKEFSFYKFRSMHIDAPKYMQSPKESLDPRITRVGRWLRRTSLDELAQLYNVLRGDMSLVGPRPEMPFIVEKYTSLERLRLDAKPGITGVWQISAARGEPIHANLEYDLFYLENRSILLDLAVIIKTILSVVRGIGAI